MSYQYKNHWIVVLNDRYLNVPLQINPKGKITYNTPEDDGKWIVRLGGKYNNKPYHEKNNVISLVEKVIIIADLKKAIIEKRNLSEAIFFTNTDRLDIWKIKKIIIDILNVKENCLIWKPNYESDIDWERNNGKMWYLNEIFNAYDMWGKCLANNKKMKADRIALNKLRPMISKLQFKILEETTMNRASMIINPVFSPIEYDINPNMIFVLMPFNEDWSDNTYHMIKESIQENGLEAKRANDIFDPSIITNDIWKMINQSGMIIADITVHNANVFYELGIAHTLGKKVLLIKRKDGKEAPFDITHWRYIEYDTTPIGVTKFKKILKDVIENHKKTYNNVYNKP